MPLKPNQIKLLQTAVRAAGIRRPGDDGRYRLLLRQYRQSSGKPVTSCKQLHPAQLEDVLALCEGLGWRCPGRPADFYRRRTSRQYDLASFAQQEAVRHLAGDLGWSPEQLAGMIARMTGRRTDHLGQLAPDEAYALIEALKNMLSRTTGTHYRDVPDVASDMEVPPNAPKDPA